MFQWKVESGKGPSTMRTLRSSRSRVLIKVLMALAVLVGLWLAAGAPFYMGF